MDINQQDQMNIEIAEIERLISEFKEKFASGTSDTENFMNISDIEILWGELQSKTNNIYSDMIRRLMSGVDQGELNRKKRQYKAKEIILKTHQKIPLTVITTLGKLTFYRYVLIPKDEQSRERLFQLHGAKAVAPMDSYLGLAGLPFKITPAAMLKIAYWAQNQSSYQRAEVAIAEAMHIKVNDDTVRQVANYVGSMVFSNDCRRAEDEPGKSWPKSRARSQQTLYIMADGAALNTRVKDEAGSTWRENKLGEVFSTDNLYYWTNQKGERQHMVMRKEYVSYLGSASGFKKHLLAYALRNG